MAGKQTLRGELEEELMEAVSIQSNFAEDISKVLEDLDSQEELDHKNDVARNEVMGFLLDAMKAYNAKDFEGMQKNVHAALQRLHDQETIDLKDDKPRTDVRIKLSEARLKAVHNSERLTGLTGRIGKAGKK